MDMQFFLKYVDSIAKYRKTQFSIKKEKVYYQKYIGKLKDRLVWLNCNNIDNFIFWVKVFRLNESSKIKNGLFVKPKNSLKLACGDVIEVLEAMRRFEGVGLENRNFYVENGK